MPSAKTAFFSLTLLVSLLFLAAAIKAGDQYYGNNLPCYDGLGFFADMGEALRVGKVEGPLAALRMSADKSGSILYTIVASILAPILPVKLSSAVVLNGTLFIGLSISLYLLFSQLTESGLAAFALTIPLLTVSPIHLPIRGIIDLNHTLIGYFVGGSAICWALLSDKFRKTTPTVWCGVMLGLLGLGRNFIYGLVGPVLLPLVVLGLTNGLKEQKRKSLHGLLILLGLTLAISGWWLLPRFYQQTVRYALDSYGRSGGSIGQNFSMCLYNAALFIREFVIFNKHLPLMPIMFGWCIGASAMSMHSFKELYSRINWMFLWIAFIPILILLSLKSTYYYYSMISIIGMYLTAFFPLKLDNHNLPIIWKNNFFKYALLFMSLLISITFVLSMLRESTKQETSKQNAVYAVNTIIQNAKAIQKNSISIDLAVFGWMNHHVLETILIFDTDSFVKWGNRSIPSQNNNALHVNILGGIRNGILQEFAGDKEILITSIFINMVNDSDYIIVMGPESLARDNDSLHAALSRRILASGLYNPITPVLAITDTEDITVLARKAEPSPTHPSHVR